MSLACFSRGARYANRPSGRWTRSAASISALTASTVCTPRRDGDGETEAGAAPDGASHYARAALREEVRSVRSAEPGGRNDSVNRAAFSLGQLVGAGELQRGLVEAELYSAAVSNGLV